MFYWYSQTTKKYYIAFENINFELIKDWFTPESFIGQTASQNSEKIREWILNNYHSVDEKIINEIKKVNNECLKYNRFEIIKKKIMI